MKIKTLFTPLLLGTTTLLSAATNDFTAQLQQGLMDEEANHDLNAAITDYQALATLFDRDRQIAATAIYRLGECYRKLGRTNEAAAQYQRILREFSDQKDLATLSGQNLFGLGLAAAPAPATPADIQKQQQQTADLVRQRIEAQWSAEQRPPPAGAPPANGNDDESLEIARIQTIIQDSPDLINTPADDGSTPLTKAAGHGWLKAAGFLLDHGADANAGRVAPLICAASVGNRAMVEVLLSRGAKINARDGEGRTALHIAAEKKFPSVAEILLAQNAPADAPPSHSSVPPLLASPVPSNSADALDNHGSTPLCFAAQNGQPKMIQMLLAAGANPNVENNWGRTPLSYAAESGSAEAVKLLLAARADPNGGSDDAPLLAALHNDDIASAEILLQAGANPNALGKLDLPVIIGFTSSDANSPAHVTPLGLAIARNQLPLVQLLLKFKADPNNMQMNHQPLLFFALSKPDILEALLAGGAQADLPQITPEDHWTALMLAAMENDADAIEILLKHGADPNLRDARGNTALHLAATFGRAERKAFESLLEHHADPNIRNNDGATPLSIVLKWRKSAANDEIAALLRQHGALEHLPDWDHITVSRTSAGYSKAILAKGTNDWNQFTLLELIAIQYQLLTASPNDGVDPIPNIRPIPPLTPMLSASPNDRVDSLSNPRAFDPNQYQPQFLQLPGQSLRFPDLAHVRIHRPTADAKTSREQTVDLASVLASGDCSEVAPLQWGDAVEVPETDHPLSEAWRGFSALELTNLDKCLTRHVNIIIKGQVHAVTLALGINFQNAWYSLPPPYSPTALGPAPARPQFNAAISKASFWLGPVLEQSQLILASSDLAHVKVTRRDPQTGKTNAWIIDCSRINEPGSLPVNENPAYLWLRDGDVIELPEKP